MRKPKLYLILIFGLLLFKSNISFTLADGNKDLHESLNLIVQQTFLQKTRLTLFFANFGQKQVGYYFGDIINRMLYSISNTTYKVLYNRQKIFLNIKHYDVLLMDNIDSFRYFYNNIKYIGNKDLARTVLFIHSLQTLDYKAIQSIFKEFYYMDIIRVALVVKLANDDIVMLTYFPFTQNACRDFTPVIINKYLPDENRWNNTEFFPPKLKNFYGCPVYCCTWEEMPYFGLKPKRNNRNAPSYVGLEAALLKYVASSLNFSFKIRWIDTLKEDIQSPEIFFSKMYSERCEVAVGGFIYRKDLDKTMTFSQTKYYSLSHICIVTNAINFYTAYEKLAFPFHYTLWYALGLTFALSSLLICICRLKRKWSVYRNFCIGSANNTPHLYLYALAVGNNMTTNHMPKRNFARFVLICWLLLTFILRIAYQSGMYLMLRDNKQWNPPQTIANVFEQKYLISITAKNLNYLEVLPHSQRVRVVNTTILETLTDMSTATEPIALVLPYEYFGYFGLKNRSRWRNLHLVRERVLTQQLTIYVRHHSYLIRILNNKLYNAQFYGFIAKWSNKNILAFETALEHAAKRRKNRKKKSKRNPLSINELSAVFMILIWLHVLSFAIFLVELICHRYGKFARNL